MKEFIKYILVVAFATLFLFEAVVVLIIEFPKGVFHDSYQSMIVDKYRMLQKTNDPKIIIVAGSSAAFGIDQDVLEEKTGYKVVNMGLSACFGHLFYTELSKENINPGDIVLLGYEYDWWWSFNSLGQDYILSGVDDNIDLYKHMPIKYWKEFIGYLFKYAEKKNSYKGEEEIVYSRKAFDAETCQMTVPRIEDEKLLQVKPIDLTNFYILKDIVEYLKSYKEYVENCGASVYFIAPPFLKRAVGCDYYWFDKLKRDEEELIGIPYISNPEDYFFEDDLMYDTVYHCNSKGEKVRTELLIKDLKKAKIIK